MPADRQSRIGGIPGQGTQHKHKRPVKPGVCVCGGWCGVWVVGVGGWVQSRNRGRRPLAVSQLLLVRSVSRQVVDVAPSLREIKVPAQYEDLQYQVKVVDARVERRSVLCETNATPSKIMEIQRALLASGYSPGKIDGLIRGNTMSAVNG